MASSAPWTQGVAAALGMQLDYRAREAWAGSKLKRNTKAYKVL